MQKSGYQRNLSHPRIQLTSTFWACPSLVSYVDQSAWWVTALRAQPSGLVYQVSDSGKGNSDDVII